MALARDAIADDNWLLLSLPELDDPELARVLDDDGVPITPLSDDDEDPLLEDDEEEEDEDEPEEEEEDGAPMTLEETLALAEGAALLDEEAGAEEDPAGTGTPAAAAGAGADELDELAAAAAAGLGAFTLTGTAGNLVTTLTPAGAVAEPG